MTAAVVDHGAMERTTAGVGADVAGFEVTDNTEASRFELRRDGKLVGYATYRTDGDGDAVIVPHVETIAEYRGNGYAARLMDGLLAIIAGDGRRIVPLCWFARGHIDDNPQHQHLVA